LARQVSRPTVQIGTFEQTSVSLWPWAVCVWLAYTVLFGGTSIPNSFTLTLQSLTSFGMIAASVWRLHIGFPTKLSVIGAIVAAASLALVLAQLLPLPYSMWALLPGRQLVVDTFSTLGLTPFWLPLTLSPWATKAAAVALLPAIAGFFSLLTVRPNEHLKVAATVIGCAMIGLFIGFAQKSLGSAAGLHFYNENAGNTASGTFGNRNFFAAQLFTSIPFVAALATTLSHSRRMRAPVVIAFAAIYMALLVAGLAVTSSRAGVVLAIVSVLLSVMYVYRHPETSGKGKQSRWTFYAILGSFFLVTQIGLVGLTRLAETDPVNDYRGDIYAVTWQAIQAYFPAGSGFGTFVPVYQQFETPQVIVSSYINHAHNDWMQIVLEGGAPALVLLLAFLFVFLACVVRVSRLSSNIPQHAYARAALVTVFLMLLHGLVDFALRTPALLSLFAVCCGMIVSAGAGASRPLLQRHAGHQGKADRVNLGAA
jgi:O-antigen ligase